MKNKYNIALIIIVVIILILGIYFFLSYSNSTSKGLSKNIQSRESKINSFNFTLRSLQNNNSNSYIFSQNLEITGAEKYSNSNIAESGVYFVPIGKTALSNASNVKLNFTKINKEYFAKVFNSNVWYKYENKYPIIHFSYLNKSPFLNINPNNIKYLGNTELNGKNVKEYSANISNSNIKNTNFYNLYAKGIINKDEAIIKLTSSAINKPTISNLTEHIYLSNNNTIYKEVYNYNIFIQTNTQVTLTIDFSKINESLKINAPNTYKIFTETPKTAPFAFPF